MRLRWTSTVVALAVAVPLAIAAPAAATAPAPPDPLRFAPPTSGAASQPNRVAAEDAPRPGHPPQRGDLRRDLDALVAAGA
ncbi:MAG TPA: hypothetical protein VF755_07355, partial [Catenuloplanes sp.]